MRQLEQWLAVPLFERRHRDVTLTPAGALFVQESRAVIKKMLDTRRQCQQVANGWRGQVKIAVDLIVKPQRCRQLVLDFYRHFPDVELLLQPEVFNGVWDALVDGRAEMAIGATRAVPTGGGFAFRDMGFMNWLCVVSAEHPLAGLSGALSDEQLRPYPALLLEDTSRSLPNASPGRWITSVGWWCRTGCRRWIACAAAYASAWRRRTGCCRWWRVVSWRCCSYRSRFPPAPAA
ncbi:HTH-type transcriptional activator AllS [Serratia rubidaea]|uniref:HTH-type transcriptional activator AllS n=1 Tax=Serratia rubidaea TaxID=61652 RepID=A0A3S5DFK9_SERRU|nr:HTH-type transcriptional activator AllS [Serratia rubidaea]